MGQEDNSGTPLLLLLLLPPTGGICVPAWLGPVLLSLGYESRQRGVTEGNRRQGNVSASSPDLRITKSRPDSFSHSQRLFFMDRTTILSVPRAEPLSVNCNCLCPRLSSGTSSSFTLSVTSTHEICIYSNRSQQTQNIVPCSIVSSCPAGLPTYKFSSS